MWAAIVGGIHVEEDVPWYWHCRYEALARKAEEDVDKLFLALHGLDCPSKDGSGRKPTIDAHVAAGRGPSAFDVKYSGAPQ